MIYIYFAGVLCFILYFATANYFFSKRLQITHDVLALLAEPSLTVVLSVLCAALSFSLLIMKSIDSAVAGPDAESYIFIAGFALFCAILSCYIFLYACLKATVLYDNKMVFMSFLGITKEMSLHSIDEITVSTLSKKLNFKSEGESYTLSGDPKKLKKFIAELIKRVDTDEKEILEALLHKI